MAVNESTTQTRLTEQVAEEIRALLARRRISGRELARRLGASHSWVNFRLTGAQPINLDELQRIADVLSVEVADLLPRPTEGRTVVVGGDARRQTTVPKADLTARSRPIGRPGNPAPKLSTRRPVLLSPAHA